MAQLLLSPVGILVQQLANSGQPLSGGQIFIYVAGTTTPQTTYTDSTGMTANANPIVLNSAGRLPNVSVWVASDTPHKMILQDSNGVTLSTIDQLYGINDPFLINQVSSVLPTAGGTANALTVANPTPITIQGVGTEQWFVPGLANIGAAAVVIDGLPSLSIFYLSKALTGGELQPGVPVLIKNDGTRYNLAWSAKGPAADTYTDTGAVNALVIAANVAQAALVDGMRVKVKLANTTTTNTPTLNIGVGGAINITLKNAVAAPAGCMILNQIADFIYEATANAWVLQNPSRATGSFTITLTGMTTTTTGPVNYAIAPDGKTVQVWIAANIFGTSNAAAMTGTGIPAVLSPATSKRMYIVVQDNGSGSGAGGNILTGTSTTWTFGNSAAGSGFTSSAQKGLFIFEVSFSLD